MVVGNGMVAKAFNQYSEDKDIIIFASGVSNSMQNDDAEFTREFNLLKQYVGNGTQKLIYFSTCSVFDKSIVGSKYISHKIMMEQFIKDSFDRYIIFRLPNVIGNTSNNNTSFNFFKNRIINQEEIRIQKQATRYIIDIDDLVKLLPFFISNSSYENNIINVCFDNKISVSRFVELIETILGISANTTLCDGGFDYSVDNSEFLFGIGKQGNVWDDDYNFNILKKYLVQ
jgi:nucleoside-diphosphate-sugar epimerase